MVVLRAHIVLTGVSFNQPRLCPNATWNSNGITFADNSTLGPQPQSIFINTDNTVYTASFQNGLIHVWLEGSTSPTGTIMTNSTNTRALFVSRTGDIYLNNWYPSHRVDVWRENTNSCVSTLSIGEQCYSLFITSNDSLYCSLLDSYRVIKRSLNSSDSQLTLVAGTGCPGYLPHMLTLPRGIFVAINFDLYVADCNNHRIQLFRPGAVNGTTVAGSGAPETIQLRYPAAVILDGDGYLFVADWYNFRIVGSGPDGFRCVIGCTSVKGSAPNQLSAPLNIAFDSHGNIFVVDMENNRVQKFLLLSNTCSEWHDPLTFK